MAISIRTFLGALLLGLVLVAHAANKGKFSSAVMGTEATPTHQIIRPTDIFSPETPQIVCAWRTEGVHPGTIVKAVWIADDTDGVAPPKHKIEEATQMIPGPIAGSFSLTRPLRGWPPGKYHVELYLDHQLVKTVPFKVRPK